VLLSSLLVIRVFYPYGWWTLTRPNRYYIEYEVTLGEAGVLPEQTFGIWLLVEQMNVQQTNYETTIDPTLSIDDFTVEGLYSFVLRNCKFLDHECNYEFNGNVGYVQEIVMQKGRFVRIRVTNFSESQIG
jgi:hypothetical protein